MAFVTRMHGAMQGEDGHAQAVPGFALAAAGMIGLGIGAANGTDWLSIGGGIVAGLGLLLGFAIAHRTVDYDIYARLERLEKNRAPQRWDAQPWDVPALRRDG